MEESVAAIANASKINSSMGGGAGAPNALFGQIVIAVVFVVIAVVVYVYPFADRRRDRTDSEAAADDNSSLHHNTSVRVDALSVQTAPGELVHNEHDNNNNTVLGPPASTLTRTERTLSQKLTNVLDVEAFLRKLREEGIAVMRLKNKKLTPKQLRLNDKGELYWAKSWFPKHVPLSKLINVIEPLEVTGGFVLEFSGAIKVLNLRVPEHEFPFDTMTVMNYFKAIRRIMNRDPDFLRRFLAHESIQTPYVEDDMPDTKSEVSELTTTTSNTTPHGANNSGYFNGNVIRTPVIGNSPGKPHLQAAAQKGSNA